MSQDIQTSDISEYVILNPGRNRSFLNDSPESHLVGHRGAMGMWLVIGSHWLVIGECRGATSYAVCCCFADVNLKPIGS
jgi:hypothetical protein